MYAIIETGGKQYKVREGDVIKVEKLDAEQGEMVEINRVLAIVEDDRMVVGRPVVDGAKATVRVLEHGKDDKIIVFKYKPKKKYRKTIGHRQPYTQVAVEKIEVQ